jgi:hypothetical protein
MTDKIVIAHAYRGFTYLPLYLAHDLGYFPRGVELAYAEGDEIAMRSVLHLPNAKGLRSEFAICDPLMIANLKELMGENEIGPAVEPIVVGSLIKRPPLWLFNTNRAIAPVRLEENLRGLIKRVRSYERPNTGYIIGRRLLDKLELDVGCLKPVPFDTEFDSLPEPDEVVVTSNILRMAEVGFNNNNTVFSYASKKTDIQDMFFTGVITRHTLVKSDLPLVLAILAGLKKAISYIVNDHADIDAVASVAYDSFRKRMDDQQFTPFQTTDEAAQRGYVRDAIAAIRKEELYGDDLEVSRPAWETSIKLRKPYIQEWVVPEYEIYTRTIPVILLRADWQEKVVRRDQESDAAAAVENAPTSLPAVLNAAQATPMPLLAAPATAIPTPLPADDDARTRRWIEPIGIILNILIFFMVAVRGVQGWNPTDAANMVQNRCAAIVALLAFVVGYHYFSQLCRRLSENDTSQYFGKLSAWIAFLMGAAGVLAFVQ